jgi:heme exporter protein C
LHITRAPIGGDALEERAGFATGCAGNAYLRESGTFPEIARPLTAWLGWGGGALIAVALGVACSRSARFPPGRQRPDHVRPRSRRLARNGGLGRDRGRQPDADGLAPPARRVAARAIAVPGAVFTAICLATGSLWGRPTWGTYWEWDGRMTSMLVLLFLYVGYVALADAERERGGEGRIAAIFGLVGAINLPIIHYSVLWWRTLHQGQSIGLTGSSIDGSMLWPLLVSALGFTLLFGRSC